MEVVTISKDDLVDDVVRRSIARAEQHHPFIIKVLRECWEVGKVTPGLFNDILDTNCCLGDALKTGNFGTSANLARHHMLTLLGFNIDKIENRVVETWPLDAERQLEQVELFKSPLPRYRFVNHVDYLDLPLSSVAACVMRGISDADIWHQSRLRKSLEVVHCDRCNMDICTECVSDHLCGSVYLLRAIGTDRYKIGYATNIEKRVKSISTGCPFPLRVVASRRGAPEHEYWLHHKLARWRVHLEWFEYRNEDRLKDFFLRERLVTRRRWSL